MLHKRFLVFNLCLLCIPVLSQELPDYQERFLSDSLKQLRNLPVEEFNRGATEGIIDPEEYKVGPGDKLFLSISGVTEITNTLLIDHEGWLYIPKVGGIDLRNSTLAEAKAKIEEAVLKYYKNVDIFISLMQFRNIKVSLTGDVVRPSIFVLSANSRLIDLIDASRGINQTADIRDIIKISKDGTEKHYDFLSFLRFGDYSNNPILVEGDVVLVNKVDRIVQISGEVQYPAYYEFRENETILDLIKLAGGFTYKAKKDTIELVKFIDDGKNQISELYSFNELSQNDVYLKNKDHVIIRQIPEYLVEYYVKVTGYVRYPGYYKIDADSTTLVEIISRAGGFIKEASFSEATVTRKMDVVEIDPEYERLKLIPVEKMTEDEYDYYKSKSRQSTGNVVVDFVKLFKDDDLSENIIMRKNDEINIPQKKDYIVMLGQFVNPGKIVFDSTLTVDDYINLAGGYAWRALEGDVRIIKAKTGEWIDADEDIQLQPGDTIWAPEDPPGPKFWDVFTDVLTIVAQVAVILSATAAIIIATK